MQRRGDGGGVGLEDVPADRAELDGLGVEPPSVALLACPRSPTATDTSQCWRMRSNPCHAAALPGSIISMPNLRPSRSRGSITMPSPASWRRSSKKLSLSSLSADSGTTAPVIGRPCFGEARPVPAAKAAQEVRDREAANRRVHPAPVALGLVAQPRAVAGHHVDHASRGLHLQHLAVVVVPQVLRVPHARARPPSATRRLPGDGAVPDALENAPAQDLTHERRRADARPPAASSSRTARARRWSPAGEGSRRKGRPVTA